MSDVKFKVQLLEAMSSLIIAAFGLVAALAWNGAIKAMIETVFKAEDDLLGMVVYALVVTVLAVAMTMLITRAVKKAKQAAEDSD
ncbi:MAG: hypothetical protein GXX87_00290 [Euryarchaeota archaeon]|jgi:hypothetical protein|nr:hypothetical protein [Euryarchaeota archaeon]